jgi:hypothetical protein
LADVAKIVRLVLRQCLALLLTGHRHRVLDLAAGGPDPEIPASNASLRDHATAPLRRVGMARGSAPPFDWKKPGRVTVDPHRLAAFGLVAGDNLVAHSRIDDSDYALGLYSGTPTTPRLGPALKMVD